MQQAAPQKEKATERREATRLVATSAESASGVGGVVAFRVSAPLSPLPEAAPLRAMVEHEGTLWAVSDRGRIFRSADRGRTWLKAESPTTADLAAVKWDVQKNLLVVEDKQGNRYEVKP